VVPVGLSLGGVASALVVAFSSVWGLVGNGAGWSLVRVDPARVRVVERVRLPVWAGNESPCGGLGAGRGLLWVISGGKRRSHVLGVSPRTGKVLVNATVAGYAFCVSESSAGLFVTTPPQHRIVRLDPRSGRVVSLIDTKGYCDQVVAIRRRLIAFCLDRSGGKAAPNDGRVLVIDSKNGRVLRRVAWQLGGGALLWRAGGGVIEAPRTVTPLLRSSLAQVGPAGRRALRRAQHRLANPFAQTLGFGRAWVANYGSDGTLVAEPIRPVR
jgi:hypothetical protein